MDDDEENKNLDGGLYDSIMDSNLLSLIFCDSKRNRKLNRLSDIVALFTNLVLYLLISIKRGVAENTSKPVESS